MAQLLRRPKPGSDWTSNELCAYNITVVDQSKEEFFGTDNLPNPVQPSLAGFMTAETRQDARDDTTKRLLHYLDLAMDPKLGQKTAVDNFAAKLLSALEYDKGGRIVFIRHSIPFVICGETLVAQTDVCIMDDNRILLLLQEDKTLTTTKDPEPQVVAEAIAAFAVNNQKRCSINLPPQQSVMFPCITMIGTSLIFYQITVTAALSHAVQTGTFPDIETCILHFAPALCRNSNEGMFPLSNRLEILQCLEAFKGFLGN